MSVVFILLPLALLFVGIAITWFVWAVRSGQYDDLETPAVRILFDDEPAMPSSSPESASDTSSRQIDSR
ncbi:MAG: cbb3-type cytochrome oxidase assembly protein CcoS [Deltaproteobacteria bacterium]|jgi:cbb3-type cytochrome oxidase maturation protein|nr:cbb3-type cytochrome oxidase assembly protein CcoS [Deltaproteobacteria bacterium]MBW2536324.1 cbb3-type cytochrome oxidase assembly protein CcoS [Deltaproteobacteria bacterium]